MDEGCLQGFSSALFLKHLTGQLRTGIDPRLALS